MLAAPNCINHKQVKESDALSEVGKSPDNTEFNLPTAFVEVLKSLSAFHIG